MRLLSLGNRHDLGRRSKAFKGAKFEFAAVRGQLRPVQKTHGRVCTKAKPHPIREKWRLSSKGVQWESLIPLFIELSLQFGDRFVVNLKDAGLLGVIGESRHVLHATD